MKNVVKRSLALMLFASLAMCAFAQPDDEPMGGKGKEKIAALKRAFITEKLELNSAEAEKFWPVYNEYEKKREALKKEIRKEHIKSEAETLTDAEATAIIDFIDQKRKEEVDLDTKFLKDCLPIIGAKRTLHLAKLEREFQKAMMEKIKERRQERQEKRDGMGPRTGPANRKG